MPSFSPASLLLLLVFAPFFQCAQNNMPWDDLLLRCSASSAHSDSSCALAQQTFSECDALFRGDEVLLRACRAAVWAERENHSLERVGTGVVSARWSSTPMGEFWFASATRADDIGLSATFEETLYATSPFCAAKV